MLHFPSRSPEKVCFVQQWLRQPARNLEELADKYHIKATRHKKFPNLVQLKYGRVDVNFNDILVRQCRGLILDEADDWRIIAWPFDKFGNVGESYVEPLDWPSASVQEKLDGSLMILYNYHGTWHVATSGTPDASAEVNGYGITFHDLFWDTWKAKNYMLPGAYEVDMTFMFELTSPFNKIVVQHPKPDIRLIGARNRATGAEHSIRFNIRWDKAKEFNRTGDIDALIKTFDEISPTQQEGYVVVDSEFRRVKVKHPGYVKLHHMLDRLTPRGLLELARSAEAEEVSVSFPEWQETIDKIRAAYDGLAMIIEQDWEDLKDIKSRKDFAELAMQSVLPATLFMLLDGKIKTAKEALAQINVDVLMHKMDISRLISPELITGKK